MLQQEQEEYQREGIQWEHIDYFNNFIICQLVDESHKGIIAIMDEACLNVGKITDSMLLEEMDRKLKGHKHYSSRRTDPMNKSLSHSEDFQIKHYAGDVVYTITGFIEKNRDTLFQVCKVSIHSTELLNHAIYPFIGLQKTSLQLKKHHHQDDVARGS